MPFDTPSPMTKPTKSRRCCASCAPRRCGEEGCVGYEVARGSDADRGTFVLFETWRDQAALDAHYETEHFQRLGVNGIRVLATDRRALKGTPVG